MARSSAIDSWPLRQIVTFHFYMTGIAACLITAIPSPSLAQLACTHKHAPLRHALHVAFEGGIDVAGVARVGNLACFYARAECPMLERLHRGDVGRELPRTTDVAISTGGHGKPVTAMRSTNQITVTPTVHAGALRCFLVHQSQIQ